MGFRNRIVRISQLVADTLVGATIETASSGQRWVMSGHNADRLNGYTGDPTEGGPSALISETDGAGFLVTTLTSPFKFGGAGARLDLWIDAVNHAVAQLRGDSVQAVAEDGVTQLFKATTAGFQIGPAGGAPLAGFDMGSAAVTTGATGQATIACNLPAAPLVAFAECVSNSGFNVVTASYTGTGFNVIVHTAAGALVANTAVTIRWAAFC